MIEGCKHGPAFAVPQPCADCERERVQAEPTQSWAVTVERNGELVVTLSSGMLAGRDLSDEDERVIRMAGEHLLSFIGAVPSSPAQFDPSNHHNALACPYCNPNRLTVPSSPAQDRTAFDAGVSYGVSRSGWSTDEAWRDYKAKALPPSSPVQEK